MECSPIKQGRLLRRVAGPVRDAPFDEGHAGPAAIMDVDAQIQPDRPSTSHRRKRLVRRVTGAAAIAPDNEGHSSTSGVATGGAMDAETQAPPAGLPSQGDPAVVASSETEEEPDTEDGSPRSPLAPLQLDLAGMPVLAVGSASRVYDTSDVVLDSIRDRIVRLADARKEEFEVYGKLEAEVGHYRELRAKQKQQAREVFDRLQLAHAMLQNAHANLASLAADINFN